MPTPLVLRIVLISADVRVRVRISKQSWISSCAYLLSLILVSALCQSCGGLVSSPPPAPTVMVQPNSAQPFTGGGVQFSAVVQNAASSAVSWQVNQIPGGTATYGTISSTGYYTAPNVLPMPATVTITAVLQSDPSATGSASVMIQSQANIQGPLTLSPALASVTTSQSLQLNVLTAGVTNSDVNWAVDGASNGSPTSGTPQPAFTLLRAPRAPT